MATNKKPINLTPEQRAIADRADLQDKAWHTIREDELNDFSLMTNILDLPKVAAEMQKRKIYAFSWRTRTPERIDELTRSVNPPLRWGLVTRTTIPELKDLIDPMLGCIPRLDQVLMYKPWAHHMIVQEAKMELANAGLNTGSLEGRKLQMQDKNADVEVMTGQDQKIGGSDELMGEELMANVDNDADGSPLGDLIES
jgi:hypothetical protein